MKQSCVSAFARAARVLAFAAVALAWGAGSLLAQGSTGKIEGRVRDQAGAPIANAQVFIVGTAFNALTNPQGYYFINNVPAGTYNVRAAFIGYKSTQVDGVKVLAGQTITVDIQLEQTAVQIQEITVVTQTQPLVPRDEVTSKQRIDGEFTSKLPVDRLNSVLILQPGVVAATPNGNTLSIRGGRTEEAVTYIDGVPVSAGYRGESRVGSAGTEIVLSPTALEEASVTTGSSSAEFGNAQSGVISIQTKTGGSSYTGTVNYETDEPFGANHSLGLNRATGSFGGPITRNFTFFLSGALQGQNSVESGFDSQRFPLYVQAGLDTTVSVPSALNDPTADTTLVPVYNYAIYRGECSDNASSTNPDIANNYGVSCRGIRVPSSARSEYQLQGKLNYSFGTGSRVAFTAMTSQNQGRTFRENLSSPGQFLTYGSLYNPQNLPAFRNYSKVFTLNWTQNLSRSTERALALETYLSYQQDRTMQGPMTRETELGSRNPFGGFLIGPMDFLFNFDNFPLDDQLLQNYRTNTLGSRRSPYDLESPAQYAVVDQWRNNAYGLYNRDEIASVLFPESGGPAGSERYSNRLILYRENRMIGKANLDWQFDRYNRLKLGGEFTGYKIDSYSSSLENQAFSDFYREKPIRYNVFAEDRLDLGDVVVVGGLRYDFYDTRARRWVGFPRISTNPAFNPADPNAFFTNDSLFPKDKSHNYISPHIQVSFPVTDRTNFRLSYAHQVQAPDFGVVLQGINTDIATTNTNNFYGSDLGFGKTITFEFGVRHAFSDDMVLDVAAYNKDNLSNAAGRLVSRFDPLQGNNQNIRIITNADFGNTRGVDVRLDRRFGNLFNGTLAYTFQQAKNTGSDPNTYLDFGSRVLNQVSGGNQPPPQAILPTDFSRPHNLALAAALNFPNDWQQGSIVGSILENAGLFATFRYTSGTPFTRCASDADETVVSGDNCDAFFPDPLNSSRLPAFKELNLRLTKGFGIGGLDLTGYVEARNVLNFKNVIQVFANTNDVANAKEEQKNFAADSADYSNEAEASGVLATDGSIDLSFGGATDPRTGCGGWVNQGGDPAAPNCVALIRTEERFGNGDHVFDLAEQRRASDALYYTVRGIHNFTSSPRRMRLGVEVNF
ncbi:MAG TPA: carboxypeptidase regulatory-like domain-containing protein [Gemmatimonadales bacterium]|nr:carboxypeptidase regulatory-like domain-containing protein [Gemmatimonadales bacterium]